MKVENMELLTIRGYNGDLMERYASGPEVFLLQRTQSTARIVRKNR
jgi:phage gp46-like protein